MRRPDAAWCAADLYAILQRYISQGYICVYVPACDPTPKGLMVRLVVHRLMARRGITAYALSQGAKLSYPSAYRLCAYFKVQPGDLLEWSPTKPRVRPTRV
jgi:DNA-binding Xre family transcriptional regulator